MLPRKEPHAAIQAGPPPAPVILSASFVREYVINDETLRLDALIGEDGMTTAAFIDQFWPALDSDLYPGAFPFLTEAGHPGNKM